MHLQLLEVLVGLQVGIVLLNSDELAESRAEFALSLLELLQLLGSEGFGIEGDLRGLRASVDDVFERFLLVLGVALDGFDEVGDEVSTTLISRLYVGECSSGFLLNTYHRVVSTGSPCTYDDDGCDDSDNKTFFHNAIFFDVN